MLNFINSVTLLRYLIIWRVTTPIVLLPRCFPCELAKVLGKLIETSLPTQQAREWRKSLASTPPHWPIEAVVFFPYLSGKRAYGKDELIIWELKLMGDHAEHGVFLELILPAMEKAATMLERSMRSSRNLWGRFDIQSIYVAHGHTWQPLVEAGKLNTSYRPHPTQWADGLILGEARGRNLRYLNWITPFEFVVEGENDPSMRNSPNLRDILQALMTRMTIFLPGKRNPQRIHEVWKLLSSDEQDKIEWALRQAESQSIVQQEELQSPPKEWPGKKIGAQAFHNILPPLLPYLDMASILHVGEHTRLGCGTFVLS